MIDYQIDCIFDLFQITKRHFPVPSVQTCMSETDLDHFCRGYLQSLVNKNLIVSCIQTVRIAKRQWVITEFAYPARRSLILLSEGTYISTKKKDKKKNTVRFK